MVTVQFKDNDVNLTLPKTLLKDSTVREFVEYIKILEIVNKSTASERDIKRLVEEIKERGREEIERLLNEE